MNLRYIINRLYIYLMEEIQEKKDALACGVFQITQDGKVVDYGLGVAHASDKFVTLKKYFKGGRELGRIFFKKTGGQQFPLSFDLSQNNLSNFLVSEGKSKEDVLNSEIFIEIILDSDINEVPLFLSTASIDSIDLGRRGYAVALKISQGALSLQKRTFELQSHIMDLRLENQTALLFVFKGNKDYCYGFYVEQGDKNLGYDLYLSDEFLAGNSSQNESMIPNHNREQVKYKSIKVPFQSIGILIPPGGGHGTAQLLKNEKGCKYLITCPHNFVGYSSTTGLYNLIQFKREYTFKLPEYYSHKPLRYVMKQVPKFKIKEVYIPKEYLKYFDKVNPEKKNKQAAFPSIPPNVPQFTELFSIKTFYDVAIIELQDNLDENHGFTIEDDRSIAGPVQVAGFPTQRFKQNFFNVEKDNMYMESTASHPGDPSYVRLSEESDGDIIMMHKLSTLPGNSGSAIYERISDTEVRLLAIHTTGVGPKGEKYGYYNLGTYIHSKNIKNWINSVFKK